MLRAVTNGSLRRPVNGLKNSVRFKSNSPLDGDSGTFSTHIHHSMSTALVVATPIVCITPDSRTDGIANKMFGLLIAGTLSAHSWVGLNYVVTDYVPKISKSLLGPARFVSAGIGLITFVGLGRVALNDRGGIKGVITALWKPAEGKQEK